MKMKFVLSIAVAILLVNSVYSFPSEKEEENEIHGSGRCPVPTKWEKVEAEKVG